MRKFNKTFSVAAFALALTLAGCSASGTAATSGTAGSTSQAGTGSATTQMVTAASISEDTHYDADDLTWDPATEVAVTLKDGASTVADSASGAVTVDGDTVTIKAAGTYRLSGALSDGKVVIAAGEEDVVRVILDGVTLARLHRFAVRRPERQRGHPVPG